MKRRRNPLGWCRLLPVVRGSERILEAADEWDAVQLRIDVLRDQQRRLEKAAWQEPMPWPATDIAVATIRGRQKPCDTGVEHAS